MIKNFFIIFLLLFGSYEPVFSAYVEMQKDVPEEGLFDLGPTAFNLELQPGESAKRVLQVTNREGHEQKYQIEVEDFEGAQIPGNSITLKGKETGRYGAKSWVEPEFAEFTIKHGERQFFEFEVNVPENADSGDHYASILVSRAISESDRPADEKTSPAINIKSRVGALLFIKVGGPTKEDGSLESFSRDKKWYEKGPVKFNLVFRNNGTVRLRPQGEIAIFDMFGKNLETLKIEPANVLRDSVRGFDIVWNRKYLAGRYLVKLKFDPDLGNGLIEREMTFWAIPWKEMSLVFALLFILLSIFIFVKKNFKFRIKFERKEKLENNLNKEKEIKKEKIIFPEKRIVLKNDSNGNKKKTFKKSSTKIRSNYRKIV